MWDYPWHPGWFPYAPPPRGCPEGYRGRVLQDLEVVLGQEETCVVAEEHTVGEVDRPDGDIFRVLGVLEYTCRYLERLGWAQLQGDGPGRPLGVADRALEGGPLQDLLPGSELVRVGPAGRVVLDQLRGFKSLPGQGRDVGEGHAVLSEVYLDDA